MHRYIGHRAHFAGKESVAGGVVHQEIDLLVDVDSVAIERLSVHVGGRAAD